MLEVADTKADRSVGVRPAAPWRVVDVLPEPGYRLRVRFVDGLAGEVELTPWLWSDAVTGTVFETLRDEEVFAQVFVDLGAVTWPNGADLAPDAMHDAIEREGRWVLG